MFFDLYFIIILSIHLRCSKRLSDISEEMKQRNVDGKVLLVALKPETKDIVLCLDTVVPTGPTSGSKIVEDSASKSLREQVGGAYAQETELPDEDGSMELTSPTQVCWKTTTPDYLA